MAVLREVKYLNFQQQKEIPGSAEKLFSENETFRKFVGNLELIVGWYNEVSSCCLMYVPHLGIRTFKWASSRSSLVTCQRLWRWR